MMASTTRPQDKIMLKNLKVRQVVGTDRWGKSKPQDIVFNICVVHDTANSGTEDDLSGSFSYGDITKIILAHAESRSFTSLEDLGRSSARALIEKQGIPYVEIRVDAPGFLLTAPSVGFVVTAQRNTSAEYQVIEESYLVDEMRVHAIIGCNDCERIEKQPILVSLVMRRDTAEYGASLVDFKNVSKVVFPFVEISSYQTVEALAGAVAKLVGQELGTAIVTVRVEKPCAILVAETAGVEITRTREQLQLGQ